MEIPENVLNVFLDDNYFKEKQIYLFRKNSYSNIDDHLHILIKKSDGRKFHFICCTTQFENRKLFLDSRNISYSTLVPIPKSELNNLDAEMSYVDCNSIILNSYDELVEMTKNNVIKFVGTLSDNHYEQIIQGIDASPLIEGDVKDLICSDIISK